jgi:hypothetical protein
MSVINAEGNSLVRHTTVSPGYKAAGAAILSAGVAVLLTVATTGSVMLSMINSSGTFMDQVGGPIAFQTSTLIRTGSLASVLDGAIALNAGSVELPSGYESDMTPAQIAAISAGLA